MSVKFIVYYAIYTLVAFVGFLYILFPGKKLAADVSQILSHSFKSVEISVDDLKWYFPLKLDGNGVVISFPDRSKVLLDDLWVKPVLTTFFNESVAFDFGTRLYKGNAFGRFKAPFSLKQGNMIPSTFHVDGQFDDISIEKFQYVAGQGDITVSCLVGGNFTLFRSLDRGVGGTGKILISNCAIDMAHEMLSSMGIPGINFASIEIKYRLKDDELEILGCRATGPEMNLTVSGKIALKSPFSRSRLDLEGHLQPDAGYLSGLPKLPPMVSGLLARFKGKGLPFKIQGTLERPEVGL